MTEEISGESVKKENWYKRLQKTFLGELLQIVLISLIIVIPFRIFIAQPFLVNGPSMDTTFANGQYLIVDQLTYHLRSPMRGEVVIFHYPLETKKFFIKRVIGLPGETVEINGDKVTICKPDCEIDTNKFTLDEPYIKTNKVSSPRAKSTNVLKADEYFVMGDNRDVSSDSRIWGPVKINLITGRPFLRLFPLNVLEVFPGQAI